MTVVPFDTLALAGKLEEGRFSHCQARVKASALADALTERVATTDDITLLRHDSDALRSDLLRDMVTVNTGGRRIDLYKIETILLRLEIRVMYRNLPDEMTFRFCLMISFATIVLLIAEFSM